jgi:hypothetical protein
VGAAHRRELIACWTRLQAGRPPAGIDFEPVLHGELYAPLRDPDFFARVALDPEAGTLVWPNGADFDPATLHDWPSLSDRAMGFSRVTRRLS